MVGAIVLLLVLFWLFGYGPFTLFDAGLFNLNGNIITLWDILIFAVVVWAIGILPSPLRQIVGIIFVLWVLSVLGVFSMFVAFTGIPQILLAIIILAIIVSIF